MTIEAIRSDFALLDDWEDRYRYVIELGRMLAPFPDVERTGANKVRGCASQVWLTCTATGQGSDAVLHFAGDSDAHIVRGLIAILFAIVQDRTAAEISRLDPHATFAGLGLSEHLTPQRSNGLASMVARVLADARRIAGS